MLEAPFKRPNLWAVSLLSLGLLSCSSASTPADPPSGATLIHHIVILVQENRTPDNLFHGLANADIADSGLDSKGNRVALVQVPLAAPYDLPHSHEAFVTQYDGGRLDGADLNKGICGVGIPEGSCEPNAEPQFVYVDPADVTPYFDMAEQYAFADHMFQTNQGPSFAAHLYLISGSSLIQNRSNLSMVNSAGPPLDSNGLGVASTYGCNAPASSVIESVDNAGNESYLLPPCGDIPSITDALDQAMVSWRYYVPSAEAIWRSPGAIQHILFGPDWSNVISPQTQVLNDIANGELAGVTWVIPDDSASDHPLGTDGSGPSWVASIVNAIGNSDFWSSTTIFVVWDDWGGFYDHVAPTIKYPNETGFRVPLIAISPYAKAGTVSHVDHDFGSLLNYIEDTFALPSLGTADSRANGLADLFDYSQTPLKFKTIPAPLDAGYFLGPGTLLRSRAPDNDD